MGGGFALPEGPAPILRPREEGVGCSLPGGQPPNPPACPPPKIRGVSAVTSCCSAWAAKCWEALPGAFGKDSSENPLQISSPFRMAAGAINAGGIRYWDLMASGTCGRRRRDGGYSHRRLAEPWHCKGAHKDGWGRPGGWSDRPLRHRRAAWRKTWGERREGGGNDGKQTPEQEPSETLAGPIEEVPNLRTVTKT